MCPPIDNDMNQMRLYLSLDVLFFHDETIYYAYFINSPWE